MRVSELFIKKGTHFRDREVHNTEASSHMEEVKAMIHAMAEQDKDYGSILRFIDYKFGPDAKQYAKKYMSGSISEDVWALPDNDKKLLAFKKIMCRPLEAKHAAKTLDCLIGTSELQSMLNDMASEDPTQDCRDAVQEYLSVAYPEIDNYMRGDDDMLRDDNIEGTLSPLGHKDEEDI